MMAKRKKDRGDKNGVKCNDVTSVVEVNICNSNRWSITYISCGEDDLPFSQSGKCCYFF